MTEEENHTQTEPSRQGCSPGVVLILVLAMLSIMVLMAFAFTVSMRTERVASGHYADSVRARQLVYAGLVRALDQINSEMHTNLWNTNTLVYPPWGVTNSYADPVAYTSGVDLLEGEASEFVPRAMWREAEAANTSDAPRRWITLGRDARINIYTNETTGEVKTNIVETLSGRVAYMIINCSGLLDANFVGGAPSRQQGTNPSEIAVGELAEVTDIDDFLHDRADEHIRYETLQDLSELNGGVSVASNLFIYSRFPQGYWTNTGTNAGGISTGLCIIGKTRAELETMGNEIKAAFSNSVTTNAGQLDLLYNNLLEYVDEESLLEGGVNNAWVEHVPMINEIKVSSWTDVAAGVPAGKDTYTITCRVDFELWNPFVRKIEFPLKLAVDLLCETVNTPNDAVPEQLVGQEISLPSSPVTFESESFYVTNVVSVSTNAIVTAGTTVSKIAFTVSVTPTIRRDSGAAEVVDGFDSPAVFTNAYDIGKGCTNVLECLDPRFNWDPSDTNQWRRAATDKLGSENTWTLEYLDPAGVTNDGDTAMYAPSPGDNKLRTVGELGYLAYAPWQTIRLRGANAHRVLDFFSQSTNQVLRGLINPNTTNVETLATAFFEMRANQYVEQASQPLSWPDAETLAGRIVNSGPYTNLSDVYRCLTNFSGLASPPDDKLKGDAFVRNAAGLFSVRQNLFIIIIEAQAARGLMIPSRPARQRAVAVIWRDPYTGESFVRSIKWLMD